MHESESTTHTIRITQYNAMIESTQGSLIDRGANGGILGADAKVIHIHNHTLNVTGIDNHQVTGLKVVDASALAMSNRGPIILIMRQYAYHGQNRTIHSSLQIEYHGNYVDDRSLGAGGRQCIAFLQGYVCPLNIRNGLAYLMMRPNTDEEWDMYPHVFVTPADLWVTKVWDNDLASDPNWYEKIRSVKDDRYNTPFDEQGNYKRREPTTQSGAPHPAVPVDEDEDAHLDISRTSLVECYRTLCNLNQPELILPSTMEAYDSEILAENIPSPPSITAGKEITVKKPKIDPELFKPYFLHVPNEKILKTFENTTQFATNVMSGNKIQQTMKSPYPATNVLRRNEPLATDTVYAEVPAICTNGQTMAQIYIGVKSLVIDVFGMSSEKQFVNTLEDIIRERGAPNQLQSDSANVEKSARVKDILRALVISDWQSEPNYQHQNPAERRWQHLKKNVQWYMNLRNVPANAWLLCCQWVADVMNHTSEKSLKWRPPLEVLTGQTIDISAMLCFLFWDVVYVARYKSSEYQGQVGSKKSSEIRGRFVGFARHVGHALTFKILTDDTKEIISRSVVRLGKDGTNNLKLDVQAGAVPERVYIRSKRDGEGDNVRLPTINMSNDPFLADDVVASLPHQAHQMKDQPSEPEKGEQEHTKKGSKTTRDVPTVETVEEEEVPAGEDNYYEDPIELFGTSPMDQPLKDQPVPDYNDAEEDLAPHLRKRREAGEPNPNQDAYDFRDDSLRTDNPTEEQRLDPDDMLNRTFLMPPKEDGTRHRAKIVERVRALRARAREDPAMAKFKCIVNGDYEEVVAYNDIVDYIEQDQTWDGVWKFKEILAHEGPLTKKGNPDRYNGSRYNVKIEWETGEITWEPLNEVYKDDPISVAIYARKHGLLNTVGWKLPGLRKIAKTQKRLIRRANQAKLHSFRTKPIYMYGFQVPRNHEQAMELDRQNGNTKWRDAEIIELTQIDEYNTFLDKGRGFLPGPGYKKIRCHLVYAVKHDGRHKARLVAGGHLTDTPIDSVYSSVVSLRGIRLLTFLAENNGCDVYATDIGNAYLESYTKEKVFIVAGPEFGDREGHTLIITKALYGLKSSGLRWHERFADVLREMGFFISKAEPDIWMRDKGDHYEYIAVYVDDLLIVSKDCLKITQTLLDKYNFKLKGTGPIEFHLGCDFFRDEDGNLCYAPRKYIEKCLENYKRMFGKYPKEYKSPLEKGDHPELDTSDLLDMEGQKIYQSLIGSLQWTIQIGRFDVATAVMTLSRFRAAPRQGHLDRVKHIYGYLSKMRHGVIRIRTEEPDISAYPESHHDWTYTAYWGAKEEIPKDIPVPRGKRVQLSAYVDANLMHDLISGRSVTGILHLANKTPIDWFTKLQSTVETATFGSEYVAARTCTEQVIDLRTTLRYLGVPIETPTMMFGDNETVVNTASIPHSKLQKRHNALSYHRTREAICAGITRFYHIKGTTNPADILSKHWDYPSVWPQLQPLLFYYGNTAKLLEKKLKKESATPSS